MSTEDDTTGVCKQKGSRRQIKPAGVRDQETRRAVANSVQSGGDHFPGSLGTPDVCSEECCEP